ncbi:hypothetical protein HPB52_004984 [Rhipicephalus sanguineus]|uniref:Uncharacterized protein n=1 Tax=Rhipicephalus sanguineus TaxID=34632 RepID=A0A9D4SXN5_RHISA|nr:hypothetical protein HPB52_004984 [Rhipicephalus sanguineus]
MSVLALRLWIAYLSNAYHALDVCGTVARKDPSKEERLLQNYMKMAAQVTEVFCQVREKHNEALHNVTVLGNKTLPAKVEQVLNKGPKYSYEPRTQRHQLLAMVRTVADRAAEDDKGRLVGDGVASHKRTRQLSALPCDDPFGIGSSSQLVKFMECVEKESGLMAFSIGIEELYYSVPHAELFRKQTANRSAVSLRLFGIFARALQNHGRLLQFEC